MSAYDGVVVGKLKLKGKPLDVKDGGIKKKKKKHHTSYHYLSHTNSGEHYTLLFFSFICLLRRDF